MGVKLGAAALLLVSAVGLRAMGARVSSIESRDFSPGVSGSEDPGLQKTTKDKLYSKEQADRGAAIYVKQCERCHTPEKVPEGKKPGPPVVGPKFLETWADKTVGELFTTILTTMPSDGSAVLTEAETLDVLAHLLKANGFPEGPAAMKNDDAMNKAIIVKTP